MASSDRSHPGDAQLRGLFTAPAPTPLSFELFPPRNSAARTALDETVARLTPAADAGFSVTMGAGGTSRSGTVKTASRVAGHSGRPVMAHLIATGMTRDETLHAARRLADQGITRILALRGDLSPDTSDTPGFAHASDLVQALHRAHGFDISVAAYPEKHPEAADLDTDIDHLRAKLDAGASRAICQFVLNPESYARFLDRCARHGITTPIIPGLMPLDDWPRVRRFATKVGAAIPDWLDALFAPRDGADQITPLLGLAATLEQARRLIAYGAPSLHVYTLNHWQQPLALARLLGADRA